MNNVLLEVKNLALDYPLTGGTLRRRPAGSYRAIDDVSFTLHRGETLGLVGESGCGKTSTARAILQLHRPTAGQVIFEGRDLCTLKGGELRGARRHLQMVFQDPYASLNPRMTVGSAIAEPLKVFRIAAGRKLRAKVEGLLECVSLPRHSADRYPHELSGGQRQRVGIARALALQPSVVIADEPVSALDVSIQAQIVNLLADLQTRLGLAYLFIAHDLAVVHHISHRVAVMYLGRIVELASSEALRTSAAHPYTKLLLASSPVPDPGIERAKKRRPSSGEIGTSTVADTRRGCAFYPRCPCREPVCLSTRPELADLREGHSVACHGVA